jgi:hypothetical protein
VSTPLGETRLGTALIEGRTTNGWLSSELAGHEWDDFLRGSRMGQFQQSSLWAKAKQSDKWNHLRVLIEQEGRIFGGFQILWRRTRLGRIGYVSKGPVLASEEPKQVAFTVDLLSALVRLHHYRAIIVQPPDESRLLSTELLSRGFEPDHFMNVISATCMVDLSGPTGEWEKNLGRSKKVEIRQASRRGLTVRQGGDADIPKFFELMSATCVRQHVRPNPGSLEALRCLVQPFHATSEVSLSFAEYQKEAIACVMDLKFGNRITTWKKGWNGTHSDLHPNSLLAYESLRHAQSIGCKLLDYAGMSRSLAENMLAERPLTEEEGQSRDIFHLELGARPRLLPPALVYWRSPALRFFYSNALRWPWLSAKLSRMARKWASH